MGNNKCRPAYKAATMWQCQQLHICNKCLWTLPATATATAASSPTLTSLKLLFIWVHASHTRIPRANVFAAGFSAPLASTAAKMVRKHFNECLWNYSWLSWGHETDQPDSQMATSIFTSRLVHQHLGLPHSRCVEYDSNASSGNT